VADGETLFDYETDKAAFECVSTAAGVLLHRFYEEGDEVPVLTPVAIVGEAGEDISALLGGAAAETPSVSAGAPEPPIAIPVVPVTTVAPVPPVAAAVLPQGGAAAAPAGGAKASQRARALAAEQGVDLSRAVPTGPNGRILERDVIAAAGAAFSEAPEAAPAAQAADASPPSQGGRDAPRPEGGAAAARHPRGAAYADEPMTKIRGVIASSMLASLQGSAQLTHHHSFDATNVLAMRQAFKDSDESLGLSHVSVGDIVLFVTSRVLAQHPEINALLLPDGKTLRKYTAVHLGVAVDTPRGLMVPTVFGAEQKSIMEISAEVKELAARCRAGNISPDKLTGGTFTVSNLGATGVEVFTPILNPPQVGILGVCGTVPRVRQGKAGPEVYSSIGLSLTYDHRVVDGAPASRFMQELCARLDGFTWEQLFKDMVTLGGQ